MHFARRRSVGLWLDPFEGPRPVGPSHFRAGELEFSNPIRLYIVPEWGEQVDGMANVKDRGFAQPITASVIVLTVLVVATVLLPLTGGMRGGRVSALEYADQSALYGPAGGITSGPLSPSGIHPPIPVGSGPFAIAVDTGKHEIFVANQGSNNVTILSDRTDLRIASVSVGNSPEALACVPSQKEVFVANAGSANVSVISDVTNKVVATIAVGSNPDGLAFDSVKKELFMLSGAVGRFGRIAGSTSGIASALAGP